MSSMQHFWQFSDIYSLFSSISLQCLKTGKMVLNSIFIENTHLYDAQNVLIVS